MGKKEYRVVLTCWEHGCPSGPYTSCLPLTYATKEEAMQQINERVAEELHCLNNLDTDTPREKVPVYDSDGNVVSHEYPFRVNTDGEDDAIVQFWDSDDYQNVTAYNIYPVEQMVNRYLYRNAVIEICDTDDDCCIRIYPDDDINTEGLIEIDIEAALDWIDNYCLNNSTEKSCKELCSCLKEDVKPNVVKMVEALLVDIKDSATEKSMWETIDRFCLEIKSVREKTEPKISAESIKTDDVSFAQQLAEFFTEVDPYDFMGNQKINADMTDSVKNIEENLKDYEYVCSAMEWLHTAKVECDLSGEQLIQADNCINELMFIAVGLMPEEFKSVLGDKMFAEFSEGADLSVLARDIVEVFSYINKKEADKSYVAYMRKSLEDIDAVCDLIDDISEELPNISDAEIAVLAKNCIARLVNIARKAFAYTWEEASVEVEKLNIRRKNLVSSLLGFAEETGNIFGWNKEFLAKKLSSFSGCTRVIYELHRTKHYLIANPRVRPTIFEEIKGYIKDIAEIASKHTLFV